jgi:hypothetical protein
MADELEHTRLPGAGVGGDLERRARDCASLAIRSQDAAGDRRATVRIRDD